MSRPLRIEYPGAWHHVMNHGSRGALVFASPDDGAGFLQLLEDAVRMFGVECHAYCLLPDHYHLLLRTPREGLSRVMRHVNGVYTQRFNQAHRSDGPLFRGRYRAVLVDPDSYLLQVSRYIHRAPVEAGLAARPEAYRWSSYRCYTGARSRPAWLTVQAIHTVLGAHRPGSSYPEYVNAGLDRATRAFYRDRRSATILGDAVFHDRLAGLRTVRGAAVARAPSIAEVIDAVRASYGVSMARLQRDGRGRPDAEPRAVAMALCRLVGGHSLSEIAAAIGSCSPAGVSKTVTRLRARIAADPALARRVAALQRRLRLPA